MTLMMFSTLVFGAYEDVLLDFNILGDDSQLKDETEKTLRNDSWQVKLNTSADFFLNRKLSYTKNVTVGTTGDEKMFIANSTQNRVLGIRINFPKNDYNAYASVRPSFEIQAYGGKGGDKFLKKGLLKNVGTLKAVRAYFKGRNFPHSVSVKLQDQEGTLTDYFLGYLQFDGWRELIWNNLNYLENVRDRSPTLFPRYSEIEPHVKFSSFIIFRHGDRMPGNFITYVSWVKVEYDKAFIETEEEIDDEAVWEIQKTLFDKKSSAEKKRLNLSAELKDLELQKMNQKSANGTSEPAANN